MAKMLYPNLEVADKYYVYASQVKELYSKFTNSFHMYFPISRKIKKDKNDSTLTFAIFMQPDSFVYEYLNLMECLFARLDGDDLKMKIIVKPHYRQNEMDCVIALCEKYPFVSIAGLNDSCGDLLDKVDAALTIHSSVVFEAMCHGVMMFIYNPDDKFHYQVYENDICFPEVNNVVDGSEQIISLLHDFEHQNNLYQIRLNEFVKHFNNEK